MYYVGFFTLHECVHVCVVLGGNGCGFFFHLLGRGIKLSNKAERQTSLTTEP